MDQNGTALISDFFLAVPFRAGASTSLGLSSHIYKMGTVTLRQGEVKMRKMLAQHKVGNQ